MCNVMKKQIHIDILFSIEDEPLTLETPFLTLNNFSVLETIVCTVFSVKQWLTFF